jgi:hypothetical protein
MCGSDTLYGNCKEKLWFEQIENLGLDYLGVWSVWMCSGFFVSNYFLFGHLEIFLW